MLCFKMCLVIFYFVFLTLYIALLKDWLSKNQLMLNQQYTSVQYLWLSSPNISNKDHIKIKSHTKKLLLQYRRIRIWNSL